MTKHYLSNKDLYKEIVISKEIGSLTPQAVKMLILLTDKVMTKFSYTLKEDKEDCRATALEHLFRHWRTFDHERYDNAFAFYTQIVKNGIAAGLKSIYKMDYLTGEYFKKPINFSRLFTDDSEINI